MKHLSMKHGNLNRRDFLRKSAPLAAACGVAANLTVMTPVQGGESKTDRPGVAAIGTGGRGSLIGHQAGSRGRVVACCDVDRKRAEGFAARYDGKCQIFGDYRRVLDRKDVDVVTVGSPDHWHAKIVVEAMKAGKDVYCEKPLTLTIDEGKVICRVARETGRIVQVGTQQRSEFGTLFLQAVVLARSGRLGDKLRATASVGQAKRGGPFSAATPPANLDWDHWLGQAPKVPYCPQRTHYDFRWWWDYSGGQVTHWGVHHVDIAMWALGLANTGPTGVEGRGNMPKIANGFEVPTTFRCVMKFAGGAAIELNSDKNSLVIEGSEGRIAVDRRHLTGKPFESLTKREKDWLREEVVKLYRGKQPGSHIGNFLECVKDRSQPIADVFTHHRSLTACHLCNISMRLGRKLRWDPAKEDVLGDAEATSMLSRKQREGYALKA
jgi:predicted dehydrogenase